MHVIDRQSHKPQVLSHKCNHTLACLPMTNSRLATRLVMITLTHVLLKSCGLHLQTYYSLVRYLTLPYIYHRFASSTDPLCKFLTGYSPI